MILSSDSIRIIMHSEYVFSSRSITSVLFICREIVSNVTWITKNYDTKINWALMLVHQIPREMFVDLDEIRSLDSSEVGQPKKALLCYANVSQFYLLREGGGSYHSMG